MAFAAAHRGLSSEKPENTLAAFGAAVAAGFPAVEMDLQLTRDGHVVILHDDSISRTTDGNGDVGELDLKELQVFDTGAGPIPTLDSLFKLLKAWDGLYNLEIKDPAALEATIPLARKHVPDRWLLSTMHPGLMLDARELDPEAVLALIPLGPVEDDDVETARTAKCQWLNVDHDFLDADEAVRLRNAGFRLGSWTVNEPTRAKELLAMGVECIITDERKVGEAVPGKATSW